MEAESGKMHQIISINIREQVERELHSAIIQGKFNPGERLVESVLAAQMGVSRAPLREVLAALEREGLVVNIPRRGSFVVDFTEKDIQDIYKFRLMLELGAIKQALPVITKADIEKLQQLVDDFSSAFLLDENIETITELDMQFHGEFCKLSDNSRLYSAWSSIRSQTQFLIGVISKSQYKAMHDPVAWHQTIVNAIAQKKFSAVEKELTGHIMDGCQQAVNAVREAQVVEEEEIPVA